MSAIPYSLMRIGTCSRHIGVTTTTHFRIIMLERHWNCAKPVSFYDCDSPGRRKFVLADIRVVLQTSPAQSRSPASISSHQSFERASKRHTALAILCPPLPNISTDSRLADISRWIGSSAMGLEAPESYPCRCDQLLSFFGGPEHELPS